MLRTNIISKNGQLDKLLHSPFYLRYFNISVSLRKISPTNAKSHSSNEWLTRQLNDVYVKRSRYDRFRCRSAYKLLEIDEKYKILKPGHSVVDCGAAPGSWTQVIVQKLTPKENSKSTYARSCEFDPGKVIAIDLQHIAPIKGATILSESNFTDPSVQEHVSKLLPKGKANAVLSDMAPKACGTAAIDCVEILKLQYSALQFAIFTLKRGGTFLCKVWDCAEIETLHKNLEKYFTTVRRIKPKASRADSAELFLLARGFKGKIK